MFSIKYVIYYASYLVVPFIGIVGWLMWRYKNKLVRTICVLTLMGCLVLSYARFVEPKILNVEHENIDLGWGLTAVVASDLHIGLYENGASLETIVEKINEQEPDIVFLPGDFTYHLEEEDIEESFEALKNLEAQVFAVTGNHDIGLTRHFTLENDLSEKIDSIFEKYGVNVIDNEIVYVDINGLELTIVGLSDYWGGDTDYTLLNNLEDSENVVVIAHNPDTAYAFPYGSNVHLVVSGHTHGGQIRLPYLYKKAIPTINDFDKGLYEINGIDVYVSPGIGMVGLPMRFLMPPQIDVLDLGERVEVVEDVEDPRPDYAYPYMEYTLDEAPGDKYSWGSCFYYQLNDFGGQKVALPEEVEASLDCPALVNISSNKRYLLYTNDYELKIYDFETESIHSLMSFYETNEGVNCIWSPNSERLACVAVNQQTYDSLTKIFVLDIEDGEMTNKRQYNETVNFVCGSICSPSQDDIWFGSDDILNYLGHEMIEDPQQTHTIHL